MNVREWAVAPEPNPLKALAVGILISYRKDIVGV
jgi:hypothetical protein